MHYKKEEALYMFSNIIVNMIKYGPPILEAGFPNPLPTVEMQIFDHVGQTFISAVQSNIILNWRSYLLLLHLAINYCGVY